MGSVRNNRIDLLDDVTLTKAAVRQFSRRLDSGFRRNDGKSLQPCRFEICDTISGQILGALWHKNGDVFFGDEDGFVATHLAMAVKHYARLRVAIASAAKQSLLSVGRLKRDRTCANDYLGLRNS